MSNNPAERDRVPTRLLFWICFSAIVGLVIWYFLAIANIASGSNLTRTRMAVTERRIRLYAERTHQLPASLEELPELVNTDNSILDAWDSKIVYEHDNGKAVTLRSLGKDKRKGGTGESSDIEYTFSLQTELDR